MEKRVRLVLILGWFLIGLGILTMNKRIFVEKKADFQIKAHTLVKGIETSAAVKDTS